jgi:CheY-like chemotaxis protein
MASSLRVLACTVPGAEERLRAALPDAELRIALTVADALAALAAEPFDLLLIGMKFDESRGLELLRIIQADPGLPQPPMAGIRGAKVAAWVAPEMFDIPMRAMGARDVIDFGSIPNDEAGNAEVRLRLLRCCGR